MPKIPISTEQFTHILRRLFGSPRESFSEFLPKEELLKRIDAMSKYIGEGRSRGLVEDLESIAEAALPKEPPPVITERGVPIPNYMTPELIGIMREFERRAGAGANTAFDSSKRIGPSLTLERIRRGEDVPRVKLDPEEIFNKFGLSRYGLGELGGLPERRGVFQYLPEILSEKPSPEEILRKNLITSITQRVFPGAPDAFDDRAKRIVEDLSTRLMSSPLSTQALRRIANESDTPAVRKRILNLIYGKSAPELPAPEPLTPELSAEVAPSVPAPLSRSVELPPWMVQHPQGTIYDNLAPDVVDPEFLIGAETKGLPVYYDEFLRRKGLSSGKRDIDILREAISGGGATKRSDIHGPIKLTPKQWGELVQRELENASRTGEPKESVFARLMDMVEPTVKKKGVFLNKYHPTDYEGVFEQKPYGLVPIEEAVKLMRESPGKFVSKNISNKNIRRIVPTENPEIPFSYEEWSIVNPTSALEANTLKENVNAVYTDNLASRLGVSRDELLGQLRQAAELYGDIYQHPEFRTALKQVFSKRPSGTKEFYGGDYRKYFVRRFVEFENSPGRVENADERNLFSFVEAFKKYVNGDLEKRDLDALHDRLLGPILEKSYREAQQERNREIVSKALEYARRLRSRTTVLKKKPAQSVEPPTGE